MNMVSTIIFSSADMALVTGEGIGMGTVRTRRVAPDRAQRGTPARGRRGAWAVAAVGLAVPVLLATGCTTTVTANPVARPGGARIIDVVAAENFWGSLVSQLG